MAEQSQADRKSQLIAELERSRSQLAHSVRGMRHGVDVGSHIKHAFIRQKTVWIIGAAITGWLLAKLPARKKKAKDTPAAARTPKQEKERAGVVLTLLSLLIPLAKPALAAFAKRKMEEFVTRNGHSGESQRFARR